MPLTLQHARGRRSGQRGLSIVELMVGVTIGLFVVAAAALLVGGQLSANRRLLLDTQLQQDMRATADIISRELRRSGSLQDSLARSTMWYPDMPVVPTVNAAAQTLEPSAGASGEARFRYQREPGIGTYGFRLSGTKLQSRVGGTWQDLTDETVMRVTAFTVTPQNGPAVVIPCPYDCPGGGQACWPSVRMREFEIVLDAQATNDATITRSIRSSVRIRSDLVKRDASVASGICPPVP